MSTINDTPLRLEQRLHSALGGEYSEPIELQSGHHGVVFDTLWLGDIPRVVKIAREPGDSLNAQRQADKGYGVEYEFGVAKDIAAASVGMGIEAHNIAPLRAVARFDDQLALVYDKIQGQNLDEFSESNTLDGNDFKRIAGGLLKALQTNVDTFGVYHRDIKPSNVMIDSDHDDRPVLIDYGLAGRVEDMEPAPLPTIGGRVTADPLLNEEFTGKQVAYNAGSELYSLGRTLLAAMSEDMGVDDIDPFTNILQLTNGQSLLAEDGIDHKKADKYVGKIVDTLPIGKQKTFLKKLLTLDATKRFDSIDDAVDAWNHLHGDSFVTKVKNNLKPIAVVSAAAALTLGAITGAAVWSYQQGKQDTLEAQLLEESKFHVQRNWDGLNLENNWFSYNSQVYVVGEDGLQVLNDDSNAWRVYNPLVSLEPGDTIDVNRIFDQNPNRVKNEEIIDFVTFPSIPVRVYVEGFETQDTHFDFKSLDATDSYGGWGGQYRGTFEYTLPNDIEDGVYTLVIEAYPYPSDFEPRYGNHGLDSLVIEDSERAIFRERIPFLVGDTNDYASLQTVAILPYQGNYLSYRSGEDIPSDQWQSRTITYEMRVPETGWTWRGEPSRGNPDTFPDPEVITGQINTLEVVRLMDGQIVNVDYFPITERVHEYDNGHRVERIDFVHPTREWSEKLIDYRRQAEARYDSTSQ